MLQYYFGNDTEKVRDEARRFVDGETGEVIRVLATDWYTGICAEYAGSNSLFGGARVYVFDTPSENVDMLVEVSESLALLQESPHVFVCIEQALTAPQKKQVQKHAREAHEFTKKKELYNSFALADALLARDKRLLWMKLSDAQVHGISAEAIIGILMWQLKLLRLALKTVTADEAGVAPFPYQKAKRGLSAFKSGEVEALSRSLLALYHDGHSGVVDLDAGLEAWVLNM